MLGVGTRVWNSSWRSDTGITYRSVWVGVIIAALAPSILPEAPCKAAVTAQVTTSLQPSRRTWTECQVPGFVPALIWMFWALEEWISRWEDLWLYPSLSLFHVCLSFSLPFAFCFSNELINKHFKKLRFRSCCLTHL